MSLNTNLTGRLRNTYLPITNVLNPLFEAVVNSIHSIDEALKTEKLSSLLDGKITIHILRSSQATAYPDVKPDIVGFEVIDNGVGFTSDNFTSFQTLDSEYKIQLGSRGVGRLLWLKAFKNVKITSTYCENGQIFTRSFEFNAEKDIHNESEVPTPNATIVTSIKLLDIRKEYSKYLRKTVSTISRDLLEHCLWYFIRNGSAPDIYIDDPPDKISLHREYDALMINASDRDTFEIKGQQFEVTHIKLKSSLQNRHSIIYSAADRVVKEEYLQGKIPGLFGFLNDGSENFAYMCFLTSDYLTEKVSPERVGFNIAETIEGMFQDEEISFSEIREKTPLAS